MPCMNKLVAITGGIGAGKSVVSHIVAVMGYPVYDTDANARRIMDTSDSIKMALVDNFGENVVVDGQINRRLLADIVFADAKKLAVLNSLVHKAVIDDVQTWVKQNDCPVCFVESAILYECGLDRMVDEVWQVTAPEKLRVERVVARSKGTMTPADVCQRIKNQSFDDESKCCNRHPRTFLIQNDGQTPVLPQVIALLAG